MNDSTRRFSDRVEDYVRYRPGYPDRLLDFLMDSCALNNDSIVADIGSGTGMFSALLLDRGLHVTAVEPNPEMRFAAEDRLAGQPGFTSLAGTAEETGIKDNSVDLITAAQAFHWFNNPIARTELSIILKPGGQVALIWNNRRMSDPFQQEYEKLLVEFGTDYQTVNHGNIKDSSVQQFLGKRPMVTRDFDNEHELDQDGFIGRIRSSSYMPNQFDPMFPAVEAAAKALFNRYQVNGQVAFLYDTRLYLGRLD